MLKRMVFFILIKKFKFVFMIYRKIYTSEYNLFIAIIIIKLINNSIKLQNYNNM